jgi:hypothetical protein
MTHLPFEWNFQNPPLWTPFGDIGSQEFFAKDMTSVV